MAQISELIEAYVALRDQKREIESRHKDELAPINGALEEAEGVLLTQLESLGVDSVKSPVGTVYRSSRASASIEDGEIFREFVISHHAFDMIDWRANATAVEAYLKGHESLPPGVKFTRRYTVGVRRPTTRKDD